MVAHDQVFADICDKLPERDQLSLRRQHGINNISNLCDAKQKLVDRQLEGVDSNVQLVLETVVLYLESLGGSVSSFSWEGFTNFTGYSEESGDAEEMDTVEEIRTNKAMDKMDADPDGLNLTAEERKQLEDSLDNDPLTMTIKGFSPRGLVFETDLNKKKKLIEEASEKTHVEFNGTTYHINRCYHHQQDNGETVVCAIRKFTNNEKKAIVALVVPLRDTILGPSLEEEPPIGVPATYDEDQEGVPKYVQVKEKHGYQPIVPLASLKPCLEPSEMPRLLFERQQVGQPPHNFGFVYENDGKNRRGMRKEINFIDLFAGCGGFHQGISQVPGFKGTAAVEWWDTACDTFKKNNPETPVHCMKVEDFLAEAGPTPTEFRAKHGKVDVLLCTPPCQSFSGSNRNVDHNSEKDLYRKGLSLQFVNAMQTSGALVGVFENVEGMWRRPNVYFLKKIVLDLIRFGYQVRVRLHRAHVFGDPQARPRMILYVAKRWVDMPAAAMETHGPDKMNYVTVGNAFDALDKAMAAAPEGSIPNTQGSSLAKPDSSEDNVLQLDQVAGTIRCGGRAWHPTHNRAISVREAATLQSYPPTYEFVGSITDQYKQVGNAVPGMMAKAIGLSLEVSLRFKYKQEEDHYHDADDDEEEEEETSSPTLMSLLSPYDKEDKEEDEEDDDDTGEEEDADATDMEVEKPANELDDGAKEEGVLKKGDGNEETEEEADATNMPVEESGGDTGNNNNNDSLQGPSTSMKEDDDGMEKEEDEAAEENGNKMDV